MMIRSKILIDEAQGRLISGIPVRFVTNETQKTRDALLQKLHRLGFSMKAEQM